MRISIFGILNKYSTVHIDYLPYLNINLLMYFFKNHRILFIIFSLVLSLTLLSYSGGRANAGNVASTLAPGETGTTCASPSCHGTNNYDPTMQFEVIDQGGEVVESYELDMNYTVRITIDANQGTPIGYGFQAVTLDSDNNAYNAWIGEPPGGTGLTTLANGRTYFEHQVLLPDNVFEISWDAPSGNLGDITFYGAAIASNANGTPIGDGGTHTSYTLRSPLTSRINELTILNEISIISNPISSGLLNYQSHDNVDRISIYNMNGRVIKSINNPSNLLDLSHFSPGVYIIHFLIRESTIIDKVIVQ